MKVTFKKQYFISRN